MPGPAVAVDLDSNFTTANGAGLPTGAASGTWAPPPVSPVVRVSYPFLTVGGVAVVHQASCTFTFSGVDAGSNPIVPKPTSVVTLPAPATVLQQGSTFVLRNGDSGQDTYGNTVTVTAAGILSSA